MAVPRAGLGVGLASNINVFNSFFGGVGEECAARFERKRMQTAKADLQFEWDRMRRGVNLANQICKSGTPIGGFKRSFKRALAETVEHCRVERKKVRASETPLDLSDEAVIRAARFTDALPLANFNHILHLVPRLVNVVTVACDCLQTAHNQTAKDWNQSSRLARAQLAEAIPVPGTGLKLPLDLHAIGSKCTNSYYAPRRFAAVQLAFDAPRCRVLVFRTLATPRNRDSPPQTHRGRLSPFCRHWTASGYR